MGEREEKIKRLERARANRQLQKDRMEQSECIGDMSTLLCLSRIVKLLGKHALNEEFMQQIMQETGYIGNKFGLTPIQCVLLAAIVEGGSGNGGADADDLTDMLGITKIDFMNYTLEIEKMSHMHIIRISYYEVREKIRRYAVYSDALEAIRTDSVYKAPAMTDLSTDELFSRLSELFSEFHINALTPQRLCDSIHDLIDSNQQLYFGRKVKELLGRLDDTNCYNAFMFMCNRYVNYGELNQSIDRSSLMEFFEDTNEARVVRDIKKGNTPLQSLGLVEFALHDGLADTCQLCIKEELRADLFAGMDIVADELPPSPDLVSCEHIQARELFYNDREAEQMERLYRMLDEDNLTNVRARMKEKGMRCGLSVIMYGAPGTGKTESCYQLARRTGRDILNVDVSKLKSKWVGDSEKQMRGMFKYYRELVLRSERVPILLFNEADAVFGKRMKNAQQCADKTENAVQDIILQEMENLDGILIATTNLETSLDPAFDRRFLMKIGFSLPTENARCRIWKSMIPELSDADAVQLASSYPFSGGQIENVMRKSVIDYIISGGRATMADLTKYCNEECYSRPQMKKTIGF